VLHEGLILDGGNRYRACQHAGTEPRFVVWEGELDCRAALTIEVNGG